MFDRVRAYSGWLTTSAQTLLIGPGQTEWCAVNITNLDIENCGKPEAIAAAIANWADRHQLRHILKG